MTPRTRKMRMSKVRLLAACFAIVLIVYGTYCAYYAVQMRKVRQSPRPSAVSEVFRSEWPHNIIARLVLFVPGSRRYNIDLREWTYLHARPKNTAINRWLLARNLMRGFPLIVPKVAGEDLEPDELAAILRGRAELLTRYPVQPTQPLLEYSKAALDRGDVFFLPILAKDTSEANQRAISRWAITYFASGQHLDLLDLYRDIVFSQPDAPSATLLRFAWSNKSQLQSSFAELAAVAMRAPETALLRQIEAFYALMGEMADSDPVSLTSLLGRIATLPEQQPRAVDFLVTHAGKLTDEHIEAITGSSYSYDQGNFAKALYARFMTLDTSRSPAVLHGIAHHDIGTAETLALRLLSEPDSTARKNTIVILVNHGSTIGVSMIDEAFSGSAPRTAPLQLRSYAYGSKATDEYKQLSGHDYLQTGKTWPPSSGAGTLPEDQESAWTDFVRRYPWFPGTDDAYYKLAYVRYRQNNLGGALQAIRDYLEIPGRPDRDAEPYIIYTLQQILNAAIYPAGTEFDPLQAVLKTNLSAAVLDEHPDLRDYAAGIDWLLEDPKRLRYISPNDESGEAPDDMALEDLRERLREAQAIARLSMSRAIGQRFLAIASLLNASHTMNSTRSLIRTLYGSFFQPVRPRPEYLEGAGTRYPDALSLDVRATQTKETIARLIAAETDDRRKVDLYLWARLHIHGHVHDTFDGLDLATLSVAAEVLDELWANETNRELFEALGLTRNKPS